MASGSAGAGLPAEGAAHELVMNGVSDVLLNIEHALSRASWDRPAFRPVIQWLDG